MGIHEKVLPASKTMVRVMGVVTASGSVKPVVCRPMTHVMRDKKSPANVRNTCTIKGVKSGL